MSDSGSTTPVTLHEEPVPDADHFRSERADWRASLGADDTLRQQGIDLQLAADDHHYTYSWEWLGVPIIRLPDDIVVLQELIWAYRPQRIVETGVARGGSMLLDSSLMTLSGIEPAVLGIDISIFAHTHEALAEHPMSRGVTLLETSSVSDEAVSAARDFLGNAERALLVLDSNHTHEHVLAELRVLAPLLPVGSFILVADTIVEELPQGHYVNRPWDRGNSPLTAANQFLGENPGFVRDTEWSRRALLTEFRDGILRRTS